MFNQFFSWFLQVLGQRPLGIYQGKPNVNTRRLVVEEGGFLYDSDSYSDDLPFWTYEFQRPHLIIPYTLDCNDMRFAQGFEADNFFQYLKDAFDMLYEEGRVAPKVFYELTGRVARSYTHAHFLYK